MRKTTAVILVIFALSLWSCSTRRTAPKDLPSGKPPEPAAIQQPPEAETIKKTPPSKTLIPREEHVEIAMADAIQESEETFTALFEEALNAYQEALFARERGDFDAALSILDEAYALILKIRCPPDSPILQEKNGLRLLIAQRIQEIYAARFFPVRDNHKTIPLYENQWVQAEITSFQKRERSFFEESYKRSGLYREMILEELKKEGLPEQLSWLPLIESGFKVRALSRARALGLWQFISSTGYRFGLKRDRWIDERMDPIKSTRAAIQYLSELHSFFGDWTTALAAYNCGELRVQNVIRTQHINYLDNFWDLYARLPQETARFCPRFIATLHIVTNPEKYGFNLPEPYPSLRYETITINRPVKLSALASSLGMDGSELVFLNPELRQDSTPDMDYLLRVPIDQGERVLTAVNSIPRWIPPETSFSWHIVRQGETLSTIASRYRTSVSAIARLNNLRNTHIIRPGQRLRIPGRGEIPASSQQSQAIPSSPGEKINHTVKRGDTLSRIASTYGTTVQKIRQENGLRSDVLHIGQRLVITAGMPSEGTTVYRVNPGDTPFSIARKFGIPVEDLLSLNGLETDAKIYPGQELLITGKK